MYNYVSPLWVKYWLMMEAVDYITVAPAHQGKGVATMMLEAALKQIDEAEMKAIVMSHPAGRENHGLQHVQTANQDDGKYGLKELFVHHFLVRQPRGRWSKSGRSFTQEEFTKA